MKGNLLITRMGIRIHKGGLLYFKGNIRLTATFRMFALLMLCEHQVGAEGVQVSPKLPVFRGNVALEMPDGTKSQPAQGDSLPSGTVLTVPRDAGALIRALPGVSLVANAGCEIRLGACVYGGNQSESTWDLTVVKGSVRLEVAPKPNGAAEASNSPSTKVRVATSRCIIVVIEGTAEISESIPSTVVKRSGGDNAGSNVQITGGAGVALDQGSVLILRGSGPSVVAALYNPATGTLAQLSPAGQVTAQRPITAADLLNELQGLTASNAQNANLGTSTSQPLSNPDFSQTVPLKPIASPTNP